MPLVSPVPLDVPEFCPTPEQFRNFDAFLKRIEPLCPAGAALVRPPVGWRPRANMKYDDIDDMVITRPIKQEVVGSKGVFVALHVVQSKRTIKAFREEATRFGKQCGAHKLDWEDERVPSNNVGEGSDASTDSNASMTSSEGKLIRAASAVPRPTDESLAANDSFFWRNVLFRRPTYGADLQGSLFDDDVCEDWNLGHLDTILDLCPSVSGVHTPYLYVGMYGSLFCFHVEDADLYGINYLHMGAPKTWYTIPTSARGRFDALCQRLYPAHYDSCKQFMRHKQGLVSLDVLRKHNIPYGRVTQLPGTFAIVFPGVYHCGFNQGFNVAEAVNFATLRWIPIGLKAEPCLCRKDTVRLDVEKLDRELFPGKYTQKFKLRQAQIARVIEDIRSVKNPRRRSRAALDPVVPGNDAAVSKQGRVPKRPRAAERAAQQASPSRQKSNVRAPVPDRTALPSEQALTPSTTASDPQPQQPVAKKPPDAKVEVGLTRADQNDKKHPGRPSSSATAASSASETAPTPAAAGPASADSTSEPAIGTRAVPDAQAGQHGISAEAKVPTVGPAKKSSTKETSGRLQNQAHEKQRTEAPARSNPIPVTSDKSASSGVQKRRRRPGPVALRNSLSLSTGKDLSEGELQTAIHDRAQLCALQRDLLFWAAFFATSNHVLRGVEDGKRLIGLGRRLSILRSRFRRLQEVAFPEDSKACVENIVHALVDSACGTSAPVVRSFAPVSQYRQANIRHAKANKNARPNEPKILPARSRLVAEALMADPSKVLSKVATVAIEVRKDSATAPPAPCARGLPVYNFPFPSRASAEDASAHPSMSLENSLNLKQTKSLRQNLERDKQCQSCCEPTFVPDASDPGVSLYANESISDVDDECPPANVFPSAQL